MSHSAIPQKPRRRWRSRLLMICFLLVIVIGGWLSWSCLRPLRLISRKTTNDAQFSTNRFESDIPLKLHDGNRSIVAFPNVLIVYEDKKRIADFHIDPYSSFYTEDGTIWQIPAKTIQVLHWRHGSPAFVSTGVNVDERFSFYIDGGYPAVWGDGQLIAIPIWGDCLPTINRVVTTVEERMNKDYSNWLVRSIVLYKNGKRVDKYGLFYLYQFNGIDELELVENLHFSRDGKKLIWNLNGDDNCTFRVR